MKKMFTSLLIAAGLVFSMSASALTTTDSSSSTSNSYAGGTGTSFITGQTLNQASSNFVVPGAATLAQVQASTSYTGGAINGYVGANSGSGASTVATIVPGAIGSSGVGGAGVTTTAFHGGAVSSLAVQGQSGSVTPGSVATAQASTADVHTLLAPFFSAGANINGVINFSTSSN